MNGLVVKKMVNGRVSYRIPGKLIARKWRGEDAKQIVPFEELQECIYDPSIKTLFDRGYLYIEDRQTRIDLGLEADDGTPTSGMLILDKAQINQVLFADSFSIFQEKMEQASPQTRENIIQQAISNQKPLDYDKSDYIRTNYKVDIEIVKRQRREEEKK